MGRSQGTFHKKEVEKRKAEKRKEKQERREERKTNSNKGKSFEDMIAYVDENGQLTSTPPDPTKRKEINLEDIQLGAKKIIEGDAESKIRTGIVTAFNQSKGYGFIKDKDSQDSLFFHVNDLLTDIKESDTVNFEIEMGKKGLNAVRIKAFQKESPL
jgi:cold shock CspA family protein